MGKFFAGVNHVEGIIWTRKVIFIEEMLATIQEKLIVSKIIAWNNYKSAS